MNHAKQIIVYPDSYVYIKHECLDGENYSHTVKVTKGSVKIVFKSGNTKVFKQGEVFIMNLHLLEKRELKENAKLYDLF